MKNTEFGEYVPNCELSTVAVNWSRVYTDNGDSVKHYRMHSHIFHEIVLVTKGSSSIVSLEQSMDISAPYIAIYPANILHMQLNKSNVEYERHLFRFIDDNLVGGRLSENDIITFCRYRDVLCVKLDESECAFFLGLATALENLPDGCLDERKMCIELLIRRLCVLIRKNDNGVFASVNTTRSKQYFGSLISFINEHYGEKLTIDALAARFYISRTKLIRDFRNVMSMTVNEYMLNIRIANSKTMLLRNKPLMEIAETCGFGRTSYFIQCFKRSVGITPSQYSKYVQQNPHSSIDKKAIYNSVSISF